MNRKRGITVIVSRQVTKRCSTCTISWCVDIPSFHQSLKLLCNSPCIGTWVAFSCPLLFFLSLTVPCISSGLLPFSQSLPQDIDPPGSQAHTLLVGLLIQVPTPPWSRLAHGPRPANWMLLPKNLKVKQMTRRLNVIAADSCEWRSSEELMNLCPSVCPGLTLVLFFKIAFL